MSSFDRHRYADVIEQLDEFAFDASSFDFSFSNNEASTQVVLDFGQTSSQYQAALNRHLLVKATQKTMAEMKVDGE